jgi:hypothetical protein
LSICSALPVFDNLRLLHDTFKQLSGGSVTDLLNRKGRLMKTGATIKKVEKNLLQKPAERVQDLYLKAQTASPVDRVKINALYREAYLAHRAHKLFVLEQDGLLLTVAR